MKTTPTKVTGWLFVLIGALIVVFSEQILTHWPVTIFYSEERRVLWATHWNIAISMAGVLTCSAGTCLLSTPPYLHRAYCVAFAASPIFVWSSIWWVLGSWGVLMTHGTTSSWWAQDCLAVAFLILTIFAPLRERKVIFGMTSLIYLILCMLLLAFSLCSQNESLLKHRV